MDTVIQTQTITFEGLQKWYVSIFEKYGWIMLAKANGNNAKLNDYKHKISKWLEHANNKMLSQNLTGLHREDITIMINNMNKLNNILNEQKGSSYYDYDAHKSTLTKIKKPTHTFYDIYNFC